MLLVIVFVMMLKPKANDTARLASLSVAAGVGAMLTLPKVMRANRHPAK